MLFSNTMFGYQPCALGRFAGRKHNCSFVSPHRRIPYRYGWRSKTRLVQILPRAPSARMRMRLTELLQADVRTFAKRHRERMLLPLTRSQSPRLPVYTLACFSGFGLDASEFGLRQNTYAASFLYGISTLKFDFFLPVSSSFDQVPIKTAALCLKGSEARRRKPWQAQTLAWGFSEKRKSTQIIYTVKYKFSTTPLQFCVAKSVSLETQSGDYVPLSLTTERRRR